MTDIVLVPVTGGSNLSAINSNFDKIEEAINTDVLHLKGGNNVMKQDLDLNGNQLLNHETDLNDPDSLINVGDADARYYNVSGDALAGNMNAAGNKILNLPVANAPHEPMRKNEVDATNAAQDAVTATNNSKTIRTPEAIPTLGNAASRADKLLSFDNSGNPVAIAAAAQSATDLELRLANNTDPAKGASLVGFNGRNARSKFLGSPSPDDYGADKTGVALSDAAFAAAFGATDYVRLESSGIYKISEPIVIASYQTLDLNGALLVADASFSGGDAMIIVTEPGATVPAWNANIVGKGKIDCAFNVDYGIEFVFARECDVSVQMIVRGNLGGVIAGTHATNQSTGINCIGVSAWFHEEGVAVVGHEVNDPNGIGIYHKNCTDSYITRCFSVGYRRGFVSGFSIEYSQCHAWSRRAHGPLVVCFETIGDDGSFSQCYADAPHNWFWNGTMYVQDGAITEVIGFKHSGTTINMFACKAINATDVNLGATDNLYTVVEMPVAGNTSGTISGLTLAGATTDFRYKSVYKNFDATVTVSGYRDKGASRIANTANRGGHLPTGSSPLVIESNSRFKESILFDATAGISGDFAYRRDNENRWVTRVNNQTESGSNVGSNLDVVAYDDNGTFIRDHARFSRSQPRTLFFGRVDVDQLFLTNFTVATVPSASAFPGGQGTVIYVTNGNSGQPCLAVSNGTNWLRIPLGAAISAS